MKHKAKLVFFLQRNDGIELLLGKRVVSDEQYFWWLPGGSVEEGEAVFAAAVRELFEELVPGGDMEQVLSKYLKYGKTPPCVEYEKEDARITLFFIQVNEAYIPDILDEFVELQWFDVNAMPEAMSKEFRRVSNELSEKYIRHLGKVFDFERYL